MFVHRVAALWLTRFLLRGGRLAMHILLRMERALRLPFDDAYQIKRVVSSTTRHDMLADRDEQYYADQYWHWMEVHLDGDGIPRAAQMLDLGCGQGRLTRRLAEWCNDAQGQVLGVDVSDHALKVARGSRPRCPTKVAYVRSDLIEYMRLAEDESFDVVVMTEVVFFLAEPWKALSEIKRLLRRGGLAFVTFRPRHFYLLAAAANRTWEAVPTLLSSDSGFLWGDGCRFNWFDIDVLPELVHESIGLHALAQYEIGTLSGIAYDPLSALVRPSALSSSDRELLMQAEIRQAHRVCGVGRYVLMVLSHEGVRAGSGGHNADPV